MGKVSIVELLNHYSIKLTSHKGSKARVRCPFHEDKKPSCAIDLDKNVFYCFPCAMGGGVVKFVMLKENLDRKHAVRFLKKTFNYGYEEKKKEEVKIEYDLGGMSDKAKELFEKIKHTFPKVHLKTEGLLQRLSREMRINEDIKNNPHVVVGLLEWIAEINSYFHELDYYYTTKEGKREKSIIRLVKDSDSTINEISKIVKDSISKEKRAEIFEAHGKMDIEKFFELADDEFWNYRFKRELCEKLKEQITIRVIRSFSIISRGDDRAFELFRKSMIDFYMTLLRMKNSGKNWYKHIGQLEWMMA